MPLPPGSYLLRNGAPIYRKGLYAGPLTAYSIDLGVDETTSQAFFSLYSGGFDNQHEFRLTGNEILWNFSAANAVFRQAFSLPFNFYAGSTLLATIATTGMTAAAGMNITGAGATYKINGTALSYADVGAMPSASGAGNLVLASPNGSAGSVLLRALVAEDLPATISSDTTGLASNLAGAPDLPDGTTATTQAQADNSTLLATTEYVDTGLATKADAFGSQLAKTFLAAPTGAAGAPSFRALVSADLPTTLTNNTSGTAANLSGTPALPNGTTATTQTQGDGSNKLATTLYVDTAATKLRITSISSGPYTLTNATDLLAVTGIVQVNLPAATGTSKVYRIKALNGTVTVAPSGTNAIDGLASPIQLSGLPGISQPTLTIVDAGVGVWYKL